MKKIVLFSLLAAASALALACSGDDTSTTDGGNDAGGNDAKADVTPSDGGGDAGNPPPTLKAQIDRMGRPAVNTALNHVFDLSASSKGAAKDAYNADKNVGSWPATYGAQFAANLAILDSLNGTCGDQAAPYAALAGLTSDDRLFVDTSTTTCTAYLGVELKALGLSTATDCGGRKLDYDVMDTTYTVAAGGASPVTDGIAAVASKTNGTTFPYLATPL